MSNTPIPSPTRPEDWENLIDNAFNIGPFQRSTKADDWWVITGMHVKLPEALVERPPGTHKLLVFADTISLGTLKAMEIDLDDWSDVLLIGARVNQFYGCTFHRGQRPANPDVFRIAVLGQTFTPEHRRWVVTVPMEGLPIHNARYDLGDGRQPVQTEFSISFQSRPRNVSTTHSRSPLPISSPGFDACRPFLARLLLTAQFLFEEDRTADANHLLDRLEALLGLNPGVASWHELAAQVAATREMLQPQLPGSDRVPDLRPDVYGGVVETYGTPLKEFADRFRQFVDHSFNIQLRKDAARLILNERADALKFQALVTKQLTDNFNAATGAVTAAQDAMKRQGVRVEEAERTFQENLRTWEDRQKREAAMAIAFAAFSFVAGAGKLLSGDPTGAKDAAKGVEEAARKASKLVELMKKLKKLVEFIAQVAKLYLAISRALNKISNAKEFGNQMATARREAESGGLDDAPSASAYWDQLWVEVETALAPAAQIKGADEYLKELKVLIIYGRALTSAQADIPPITQELAQSALLTEIARRQSDAIEEEIGALQARQPASALAAVALWIRHRSVQRAMLAALQDYDAAHRYWALTDERPQLNPSRSITDIGRDLLFAADIQKRSLEAFKSFTPPPQDFKRWNFTVRGSAVADFLRDGRFSIRFMPDFGPFAGEGNVGRVRVSEIFAWVDWNEGKRPEREIMQFTIRTNGEYYDQRLVSRALQQFRFTMNPVNFTFRYNLADDFITVHARIAKEFRDFYPDPTLFTEWQFSLPGYGGAAALQDDGDTAGPEALNRIGLDDLQGAVNAIRLEFSGQFIKDPVQF